MRYSKEFYKYLFDLSKKKSNYGGGSAICLIFCLAVSLIEKALVYSSFKDKEIFKLLRTTRKKILPYIDKDGELFVKALRAKGKKQLILLNKSQKIIIDTGVACYNIISLLRKLKPYIKDVIKSDFYIGLDFLRIVLNGCVYNLEANANIFAKSSRYIDIFKKFISKIKLWEKF